MQRLTFITRNHYINIVIHNIVLPIPFSFHRNNYKGVFSLLNTITFLSTIILSKPRSLFIKFNNSKIVFPLCRKAIFVQRHSIKSTSSQIIYISYIYDKKDMTQHIITPLCYVSHHIISTFDPCGRLLIIFATST